MTWSEFKAAVEEQGVTDDTMVGYIDVLGLPVEVQFDDDDGPRWCHIQDA